MPFYFTIHPLQGNNYDIGIEVSANQFATVPMGVDKRIREFITNLVEIVYCTGLFIEKVIDGAFAAHETQAFLSFEIDIIKTAITDAHLGYLIESMINS